MSRALDLRVRSRAIGSVDPLAVAAAAKSEAAYFGMGFESNGLEIASIGAVETLEASGPRRFDDLEARAKAVWEELREWMPPEMPAAAAPRWLGGFAFGDDSGSWEGFAAARFTLAEQQIVRHGDETWLTTVEPSGERPAASGERRNKPWPRLDSRSDPVDQAETDRTGTDRAQMDRAEEPSQASPLRRAQEGPLRQAQEGPFDRLRANGDSRASEPEFDATALERPLPRLRRIGGEEPASWFARVERAREEIRQGRLEKVVLGRVVEFEADEPLCVFQIAARLRRTQPGCLIYALRNREGHGFVGATPELLVRRRGREVESWALAGSARSGTSGLRESTKDQREHAPVIHAVRRALEPVAWLKDRTETGVLSLAQVQHLRTPISGVLRRDTSLFELAGRLHPTPAIAGAPTAAALEHLSKHEPLERGWYCGGIGWMEANGDGEIWVGLRCARVEGRRLRVYAGAGIVEASDPRAEWDETELKMQAMLSVFADGM